MNKSEALIPIIQKAKSREEAIEALTEVVSTLHLSQNYFHLVELKDKMDQFKNRFRGITDAYKALPSPRNYPDLHELRMELSFLSRDLTDELAFEVNKSKIFHEERKTEARAIAMMELKEDKEFQKKLKATSTSALRDVLGASGSYQEFMALASFAYGLYQEYMKLVDSMKMFNDALASECRDTQYHDHKDVK